MKCVKWGDRLKLEEFALHSTCIGSAPNVSHFVPSHKGALFFEVSDLDLQLNVPAVGEDG